MSKMEPKHKILVLTDLKESTESVIDHAKSLSSLVDSEVLFVHVKKPSSVVASDNQFSAIRSLNKDYRATSKSISLLADQLGESANYKILYGNVRGEIKNVISQFKPNTVVLGKRKPKFSKIIGDRITDLILKKHDGAVVIAAEGKNMSELESLSLGALNSSVDSEVNSFVSALVKRSNKPLKVFKTYSSTSKQNLQSQTDSEHVEFVFEQGANAMDKVSKYMSISKINMLLLSRRKNMGEKSSKKISQFRNLIKKVDASVVVTS